MATANVAPRVDVRRTATMAAINSALSMLCFFCIGRCLGGGAHVGKVATQCLLSQGPTWPSWGGNPHPFMPEQAVSPKALLTLVAALPPCGLRRSPPLDSGSVIKFSVEITPVAFDADLSFSQVTPTSRGGGGVTPLPF